MHEYAICTAASSSWEMKRKQKRRSSLTHNKESNLKPGPVTNICVISGINISSEPFLNAAAETW